MQELQDKNTAKQQKLYEDFMKIAEADLAAFKDDPNIASSKISSDSSLLMDLASSTVDKAFFESKNY